MVDCFMLSHIGYQGIAMELVTSLPLPPDYWSELSIQEIESLEPPKLVENSAPFGIAPISIPDDLNQDNRTLKTGIMLFTM